MNFADIKARTRQDVHNTFAVPCEYRDTPSSEPVNLTARLHTRIMVGGSETGAYATIIEGVTRVIFDRAELAAKTVAPKRKAVVTFPDYGSSFLLDARDPRSGPVTEKWSLADM